MLRLRIAGKNEFENLNHSTGGHSFNHTEELNARCLPICCSMTRYLVIVSSLYQGLYFEIHCLIDRGQSAVYGITKNTLSPAFREGGYHSLLPIAVNIPRERLDGTKALIGRNSLTYKFSF